jgi:hypothetical protein
MAAFLHLVKKDTGALAAPVILANAAEAGARVTVVLLDGAAAPAALPAGVTVRRLAAGELDYAGLLDLIFAHDHVVTW